MFYLYKLSFKKYYYIGVTNDATTRKWQHHSQIVRLVYCLINDSPINFVTIPACRIIAQFLFPLVKDAGAPEKEVQGHYSFSILRRSKTQTEIQELESRYLKKSDKYNLNHHKESFYKREVMIKEKPYILRGNNKSELPCVVKIVYGNRYVIAKFKSQPAGLKRIEDTVNSFMRGGTNNPDGLYFHLLNYVKRQPQHKFVIKTLLFSDNPYELLKKEQGELWAGQKDPNFLNNQVEAYIPQYNEEKKMYGGWIPQIAVLNFRNWIKTHKPPTARKMAKKTAG